MEQKVTRRDLQNAICESAWAIYCKGVRAQYDSNTLSDYDDKFHGGNFRTTLTAAPEYGTRHTSMYQVCSAFAYNVYHQAVWQDGAPYRLNGGPSHYSTRAYYDLFPEKAALIRWTRDEQSILRFSNRDVIRQQACFKKFAGWTNREIAEWWRDNWEQILQPGDLMLTFTNAGAHTVMYIGHGMMLESQGLNYKDGMERYEPGGTIKLYDVRDYYKFREIDTDRCRLLLQNTPKPIESFGVFRPINLLVDENDVALPGITVSPSAAIRQKNRVLDIDKIVNVGPYGTAVAGGELTYTVSVTNHSNSKRHYYREKDEGEVFNPVNYSMWAAREYGAAAAAGQTIEGLEVVENLPAGTELMTAEGAAYDAAARTLRWTYDLAAGETKDFVYTVKVTAERGSDIVSEGTVARLPSARIVNRVGGEKLPVADKIAAFMADPARFEAALQAKDTAFASAFYKEVFGMELALPTGEELFRAIFEPATPERTDIPAVVEKGCYLLREQPAAGAEQWLPMLVRNYVGGTKLHTVQEEFCRVREFTRRDLEAGDIFVRGMLGEDAKVYVGLGGGMYARLEDGHVVVEDDLAPMWISLLDQYFFTLRPTQVL